MQCVLCSSSFDATNTFTSLTCALILTYTMNIIQKYDFIINKLVAAVDAEFTLLNNKLAMQQQQPHGEQY